MKYVRYCERGLKARDLKNMSTVFLTTCSLMMESDFTSTALRSGVTTGELDDVLLSAGDDAIFSTSISDTNKCWLDLSQFQNVTG
jgi:hypothetical protein